MSIENLMRLERRAFLGLLAVAAAALLWSTAGLPAAEGPAAEKPILSFGVIADVQYADIKPEGGRHYRESLDRFKEAVQKFNELKPDFVIHTGDFIDRDISSYDAVLPVYERLSMPHYFCLGNHDFAVKDDEKAAIVPKLGLDKRGDGKGYYDFATGGPPDAASAGKRAGWRFVVLNGNDVSIISSRAGSDERKAAEKVMAELKQKGAKNAGMYNGAVGPAQLAWLKATLAKADAAGEKTVVFCHFPVYPATGATLWNGDELVSALESAKGVVAYIAGHDHKGGYAEKNGIHYLTVCGMVETNDTAYALVEVRADGLHVTGFGRQPTRVLAFKK